MWPPCHQFYLVSLKLIAGQSIKDVLRTSDQTKLQCKYIYDSEMFSVLLAKLLIVHVLI